MSPDLAARRVAMSAYLYYQQSSPVLTDDEYDALARYCAEHWDELDAFRKWQLGGSSKAIAHSGHQVRVTKAAEGGAFAWHLETWGRHPPRAVIPEEAWVMDKKHHCRYAKLTG